jgi:hypothetical protein
LFDIFHEGKVRMNKTNALADRIALGLGIVALVVSTGCIVPVGGGGYDGGGVVSGPDMVFYGGDYGRGRDFDSGRDVHAYSERGVASRAAAHPGGGGHVAAPHGGGGGGEAKRR